MRMSVTSGLQSKAVKKYVLQQSNCNVDVNLDKEEDQKPIEKIIFPKKIKEEMDLETENQCSPLKPDKGLKSDAKKLRSVRLDLSSLKRGAIKETNLKPNDSSEESSEDEIKKKQKTRPIVPNYVTNTDSGPCRKPRQSRQDQLSFSSQNSPKLSSQILSIERRNARERNRVKLVNEGFASLQDRIPDFISEAYNEEKGKKSAKKLSKVDTLRMAVDYIRHLETLLDLRSSAKTEDHCWDPATPGGYQSPKYQPSCVDSPGTSFDQQYDQDRIFYPYDMNFESQKETLTSGEEHVTLVILKSPNSYVEEDFKYYETFNSIKKENVDDVKEKISEGEEENLENLDVTDRDSELLPKDVIKMEAKDSLALPLNSEPFAMNEGITIFF